MDIIQTERLLDELPVFWFVHKSLELRPPQGFEVGVTEQTLQAPALFQSASLPSELEDAQMPLPTE